MTEKELMSAIERMARQLGYLVFHNHYAVGSAPGFPDLCIVGHRRVWFFECKGPRGRISEQQVAWIDALSEAGLDARVIWPADLDDVLAELMTAYQEAA